MRGRQRWQLVCAKYVLLAILVEIFSRTFYLFVNRLFKSAGCVPIATRVGLTQDLADFFGRHFWVRSRLALYKQASQIKWHLDNLQQEAVNTVKVSQKLSYKIENLYRVAAWTRPLCPLHLPTILRLWEGPFTILNFESFLHRCFVKSFHYAETRCNLFLSG